MWISTSCAGRILRQHLAPISRLATISSSPSRACTAHFSSSPGSTSFKLPTEPSVIPTPVTNSAISPSSGASSSFTTRTHTCGELGLPNVGQTVTICGWLQFQRMRMFLTLRDGYGQTQVIIPDRLIDIIRLEDIPFESILQVRGRVVPRPAAQQNRRMATGYVEVLCDELLVLNRARSQLPMDVRQHNRAGEQRRLEFRYIDLRFADMQRNLRRRSAMLAAMRAWLTDRAGFVEVETPTLFRRTPGGAQEFVVPTRRAGQFYSLVQSPQQFKQMLMAGAVDRYFQVARCYRDESTRPDRQPEFTQLDIELSFTDRASIQLMIEQLLQHCWSAISDTPPPQLPFPRITYAQAMSEYGCDKPDTRFGMKIRQLQTASRIVHAILVPENTRGKFATGLPEIVAKAAAGGAEPATAQLHVLQVNREPEVWCKHNKVGDLNGEELAGIFGELQVQRNNTVLLAFGGRNEEALTALGRARLATMDFLESHNLTDSPRSASDFKFLWVVDFPMFAAPSDGSADAALETVHHPFTAAHPEDADNLLSGDRQALLHSCRSQAYDLVLNGLEVGGGSIRIHDAQVQRHVLNNILCIDHRHLAHLLDALASGCPPHGGIALGVDRLVAILCEAASIRDVIAFPKSADGRDALSKAPVAISAEELELYHIRVREEDVAKVAEKE